MIVLGKHNKRTSIFNLYRPCKGKICDVGAFKVIKQKWLIMQKDNIHDHPREAVITDIIKAINNKLAKGHEIIVCLDSNEAFTSGKSGIAKLCKDCKLYDPLEHRHRSIGLNITYQRGSTQMCFIFCTFNTLISLTRSGMTAFGDIITSDHKGLFIDMKDETFLTSNIIAIPPPLI